MSSVPDFANPPILQLVLGAHVPLCSNKTTTWKKLIDDLSALRPLEEDWDGQGAAAPPSALVDEAIALAQHFQTTGKTPADRVLAGVNGTIFFEWYEPSYYLEIEVTAPDKAEGRIVRKGSDEAEVFTLSRSS